MHVAFRSSGRPIRLLEDRFGLPEDESVFRKKSKLFWKTGLPEDETIFRKTETDPTRHIAVALYLPRITTGGHGRARWVVDRWLLWAKDTFRSGKAWGQVVGHAGGRGRPLLGWIWRVVRPPRRDSWP